METTEQPPRLGAVAPLDPGDPRRVGRYVLLGRLGAGGMGAVYLGRVAEAVPGPALLVAVKVVHRELAEDAAFRARFADEVTAARRVAPFCTARVLDADPAGNPPYLVTEYIDGVPLGRAVTDGGPLDSSTLHGVALGVAAALAAIHVAGVVHRDLKPSNVLLCLSGPRVIDFGIARALDVAAGHTQAGTILGTPGWMAPEQFRGGGPVGPAADVFSWASLVGFAATGRNPWGDEGPPAALAYRIIHEQADLGGLGGPLRPLVEAALRKDPARRPTAPDLVLSLVGAGAAIGRGTDATVAASHLLRATWVGPPTVAAGRAVPPAPRSGGGHRPLPWPPGGTPAPGLPRTGSWAGGASPRRTAVLPGHAAVPPRQTAVLPPGVRYPSPTPTPTPTPTPPPRSRRRGWRAPHPSRPPEMGRGGRPPQHPIPGPRRRRRWYRKKRYLIPLALLAVLFVSSSSRRRAPDSTSTTPQPGATHAPGARPATDARPQLGVPVRDGQLEFVLRNWQCGIPSIGQSIFTAHPRGQFCVALLQVRNIGSQPRVLFEPLIKVYETNGDRHNADGRGRLYYPDQSLWVSVDPGQTITGRALFDIPKDARATRLEVHDGLLSGGTQLLL